MSDSDEAKRLGFVDGVRAIAALVVFFAHGSERGLIGDAFPMLGHDYPLPMAFIRGGYLGVTLFFFISGFVIFLPFAKHLVDGRPRPNWGHFFSRRFWKIVPSYVFILVLLASFAPAGVPKGQLAYHFFSHLFFLHGLWQDTFLTVDGPMWSLAIEVQFYLTFPLLCIVLLRNVWLGTGLMALTAVGYRLWLTHINDGSFLSVNQYIGQLDTLAAGVLSAYLYVLLRRGEISGRARNVYTLMSIAGAIAVYFLFVSCGLSGGGPFEWNWERQNRIFVSLAIIPLVVGGLLSRWPWRVVLANPVMAWLAIISYNLYLWHTPVLNRVKDVLGPVYQTLPHETIPYESIFLSFAAAILATYLVERPLLRNGPRLTAALVKRLRILAGRPAIASGDEEQSVSNVAEPRVERWQSG